MNDVKVQGLSHQDASAILREAETTAKLVLGRPNDPSHFNNLFPKEEAQFFPRPHIPSPKPAVVKMKNVQQEHEITLNKVSKNKYKHVFLWFVICSYFRD